VFYRMAEILDIIQYIPTEEEEECKVERLFDNDVMEVSCAQVDECKGDSSIEQDCN
jgi:hypothetical protein